jgi:chaperonin GroEL (HSP60 family)
MQARASLGSVCLSRYVISVPNINQVSTSDMNAGTIGSMRELGITESYKLKRQVVNSASEAAEMIIRYGPHAY